MRKVNLIALMLASTGFIAACNSGNNTESESGEPLQVNEVDAQPLIPETQADSAIIELISDEFDFGTIKEGEVVTHKYTFTNTGGAPLIIAHVQASCGCTTPEYTKTPVAPGEEGYVNVEFKSAGQTGKQHKIITVLSNATKANTLLHLRGEVVKK